MLLRSVLFVSVLLVPADPAMAMKPIASSEAVAIDSVRASAGEAASPEKLSSQSEAKTPTQKLIAQISARYPGARVELTSPMRIARGSVSDAISDVAYVADDGNGQVRFNATDSSGDVYEGTVRFSAWIPAWVLKKRILPGERLSSQDVVKQEVNAAFGMAHELRGLILPTGDSIESIEARQTLIEGQFITTSAIQKVPDLKRGDSVRIRLLSGGITLTTQGSATEPGFIDQPVRVMTLKGKRDLVGKLGRDGTVEVSL